MPSPSRTSPTRALLIGARRKISPNSLTALKEPALNASELTTYTPPFQPLYRLGLKFPACLLPFGFLKSPTRHSGSCDLPMPFAPQCPHPLPTIPRSGDPLHPSSRFLPPPRSWSGELLTHLQVFSCRTKFLSRSLPFF